MLFCDKHFKYEFLKVERWAKFIGIPFFTIMSTLFLSRYPFNFKDEHFLYHIGFSAIGVFGIWFSVRGIAVIVRKRCNRLSFLFRLLLQVIVSSVISVSFILVLHHVGWEIFNTLHSDCPDDMELKNILLTSILLTFLIITIYEGFYLFLRLTETVLESERYKKESIEAKYQNLTSRLNPHFLFNSLNTLTTIVEEDRQKAVSYIQELSVVYRYVLNSEKSTWIDLPSEIKFTNSYITLLKMRFEENLRLTMDICEKHQRYCILPLTIQLLIENAVKHNEISNSKPLFVNIFCDDEYLIVSNNKQIRQIMSSTKVGLHNIKERYRFLVNKEVIVEEQETSFTVKIPLVKINQ